MFKKKLCVILLSIVSIIAVLGMVGIYLYSSENEGLKGDNDALTEQLSSLEMKFIALETRKDEDKLKERSPYEKIEAFYKKLTLEQKVGQLLMAGHKGTDFDNRSQSLIKDRHVAGFCFYKKNAVSKEQVYGLIQLMQDASVYDTENGIPLFIAGDNEPGRRWMSMSHLVEPIPTANAVAKNYNPTEAETMFDRLSKGLVTLGYNIDFAPVADVNTNPDNPIIGDRSFSDDPDVVIEYTDAMISAFRGNGLIPCVKHFPGHGDTDKDSHKTLPHIAHSLERLKNIELKPFINAIDSNIEMIMTAHIIYDELDPDNPATLSKTILTDMLRDEYGYDGVVISDDMYMQAVYTNYKPHEAVVKAVNAGVDVILAVQIYDSLVGQEELYDSLLKAVEDGIISESRLKEAVMRILMLKATNPITAKIWGERNPLSPYYED